MAYVYRHIRLDKNEPFYIGIGSDKNYNRAYNKVSRTKFWKAVINKTQYEVEIIADNLSWEEACKKEIEFIKLYGRKDLGVGTLVNLTDGGNGGKGKRLSEEHKKILSNRMKGKCLSKGVKRTEEHKKLLSERMKGKKLRLGKKQSEEAKRKIGEAVRNRKYESDLDMDYYKAQIMFG